MERVRRMFPEYTEASIWLGGYYLDTGDTARAVALFGALARQRPADPEVRYYYGITLAFLRDVTGALREFDAAIALEPGYARPYYGAYYALVQAGQFERALSYLQRLVETNPGETQAQQLLEMVRPQGGAGAPIPPPPPGQP